MEVMSQIGQETPYMTKSRRRIIQGFL